MAQHFVYNNNEGWLYSLPFVYVERTWAPLVGALLHFKEV